MNETKKTRVLDRTTYSRKTLDIFEIIAAFFVDMYYNHAYIEAKKLKADGRVNSITEGYKHVLGRFFKIFEDRELYKKTLMSMHNFANTYGVYSNIRLSVFIKHIVDEFVPNDFRESLTSSQETILLREITKSVNQNLIKKIMEQYLVLIIDKHMEADNVRVIQEDVIDMLILEREAMYQKFYLNSKEKRNNINMTMLGKMRDELKDSYAVQAKYKKLILRMNQVLTMKDRQLAEKSKEIEELRTLLDSQTKTQTIGSYPASKIDVHNETHNNEPYTHKQYDDQNYAQTMYVDDTKYEESAFEEEPYELQSHAKSPRNSKNSDSNNQLDMIENIIDTDEEAQKNMHLEEHRETIIKPPSLDLFEADVNQNITQTAPQTTIQNDMNIISID